MLQHCDQITHFEGKTEGGSQLPLDQHDSSLSHGLTHLSPPQKPQTYSTGDTEFLSCCLVLTF